MIGSLDEITSAVKRLLQNKSGYLIFSDDVDPYNGYILSIVDKDGHERFEIKERLCNGIDIARVYFELDNIEHVVSEYVWRMGLMIQDYWIIKGYRSSKRMNGDSSRSRFSLKYVHDNVLQKVA